MKKNLPCVYNSHRKIKTKQKKKSWKASTLPQPPAQPTRVLKCGKKWLSWTILHIDSCQFRAKWIWYVNKVFFVLREVATFNKIPSVLNRNFEKLLNFWDFFFSFQSSDLMMIFETIYLKEKWINHSINLTKANSFS